MRAARWSIFLFLPVFPCFAQADRGLIAGTVADSVGAAIPGASIKATDLATNRAFNITSNDAGEFSLTSLPLGTYRVKVDKDGFQSVVHDKVRLDAGVTVRLDTKLVLGAVSTTVVVSAEGGAAAGAAVGGVVGHEVGRRQDKKDD